MYARAFFFRDSSGQSLALVSCDLSAIPQGLHAEVVYLLGKVGRRYNLSNVNLVLAATHIHHGPGNFFSYRVYNDRASPAPGFDKNLFEWLAKRIAAAIEQAALDAEGVPPGIRTRLVFKQGKVSELLRNRAPGPFLLNSDRDAVLGSSRNYTCDPNDPLQNPYPDICPRYNAVDETLSLLEIHRGSIHIGSLVFLSVHPEAMSHETALYQSDFTGLAMLRLEQRDKITAAFFNGADGDISVRWKLQNRNEAVNFAERLVRAIDKNLQDVAQLDGSLEILTARKEIIANAYFVQGDPRKARFEPYCRPQPSSLCLAGLPLFGVATAGGAEDARTPLFDLGWKPGVRTLPRDGQGGKLGAFESVMLPGIDLTRFISPTCYYPESFPVALISLRGFMTSGSSPTKTALTFPLLAAEFTRTMWWRTKKSLDGVPQSPLGYVVPIGLANDYIVYVTTREEYGAQGYEGASDIFGPDTGDVIREELVDLIRQLGTPVPNKTFVPELEFFPETELTSFGPEALRDAYPDPDEALESLLVDEKDIPYRFWPRFEWCETGTDLWSANLRTSAIFEQPPSGPGVIYEDEGAGNLLTVYLRPPNTEATTARLFHLYKPDRVVVWGLPPALRSDTRKLDSCPRSSSEKSKKSHRWMGIWLARKGTDVTKKFYFSILINNQKDINKRSRICSEIFTLQGYEAAPIPKSLEAAPCPR